MRSLLFALLLATCATEDASGQDRPFNAGFVGGLNFAELVGNGSTDYFGLNAGVMGTARFARHGQLSMEMLYSQNGEYVLPVYYPPIEYGRISLQHLEIPVHVDLLIGLLQHDEFYDWQLSLGVAYTRLMDYRVRDIGGADISEQVIYDNTKALLLQGGTTYHFSKRAGVNFRASLPIRVDGLSWTYAARMIYMLG